MKASRHSKIIELINTYDIETQDELTEKLNTLGYNVTQATISRDIRELKLLKVIGHNGRSVYATGSSKKTVEIDKYSRAIKDGFLSCGTAANIVVIHTNPGMAMAVAMAIDNLGIPGIEGSIAGDDTVFCAVRSKVDATEIMKRINSIIKE